jgi:hypothetical protein
MKYTYGGNIAWQIVGDEAVIIDLASGTTVGLNPTATFIWSRLPACDVDQIAAELEQSYESNESMRADVVALIDDLKQRNLIAPGDA